MLTGGWPFPFGDCPCSSSRLDGLVVETERLLVRFYALTPSELRKLKANLDWLADCAEKRAEATEWNENPPTSWSP